MAQAQDYSVFSHYHISPVLINPAAAGFNDNHEILMNLRNQWTGFPGAPKSYGVTYNGAFGNNLGLGVGVLSDNIGPISRMKLKLDYAFHMDINKLRMATGLTTEFSSNRLASSVLSNPLQEDGDVLIMDGVDGINVFDAAFGFYGTYDKQTRFGLSFPNLIVKVIGDIEDGGEAEGSLFGYYTMFVSHEHKVRNYGFTIEPSMMIRKVYNVPFQIDFNVLAGFLDKRFMTGLSYRSGVGGALGLMLGTELYGFKVFYSYDVSFANFQQYNNGTHEITVGFDFKRPDVDYSKRNK